MACHSDDDPLVGKTADDAADLTLGHDPVADHARVFEKVASQNADGTLTEMALLIEAALADTLANFQRVRAAS